MTHRMAPSQARNPFSQGTVCRSIHRFPLNRQPLFACAEYSPETPSASIPTLACHHRCPAESGNVKPTELLTKSVELSPRRAGFYRVGLAATSNEILAAQRLRDDVFTHQTGARTPGPAGIDADEFDELCDHLVVWHRPVHPPPDQTLDQPPEHVVATYRLLPPHRNHSVPRARGLYSAQEFDLTPLEQTLRTTVEAGRACVHPDHRTGTAISLLWSGILRYMRSTGNRHLLGCGSICLRADGHATAAEFWRIARRQHLAPTSRRCDPRTPLTVSPVIHPGRTLLPPLLKAYLLLGAEVCGPPALDEAFRTADFLLLLDLQTANPRYLRRLAG